MRRLLCQIGLHSFVRIRDAAGLREYTMVKPGLYRERNFDRLRCRRFGCDATGKRLAYTAHLTELPTEIGPTYRERINLTVHP